jgi:hypothetical protein
MRVIFGCFCGCWFGGRFLYFVFDLDVGIVVDCAQCGQVLFLHYNNYSATAIQNDKSSNHNKLLTKKTHQIPNYSYRYTSLYIILCNVLGDVI